MSVTSIHVEALAGSTGQPERVTLNVRYGDKECRLELPVPAPLFDREPGVEAYRRALLELLEALEEWEASHAEIAWRLLP